MNIAPSEFCKFVSPHSDETFQVAFNSVKVGIS
jgi:hypothetical protein